MSGYIENLQAVIDSPPFNGSTRALARAIGVDHSHLSRVLDGERELSPKIIGRVAKLLPRRRGDALIKEYLRNIASEIATVAQREPVVVR